MDSYEKDAFIEHLALTGLEREARTHAGVSVAKYRKALDDDPDFAEQVQEAKERAVDLLEVEARRRAVDGVTRHVYYKGEVVGEQTEYSDSLLMFLLKANRPDKFGDKTTIKGSKAEPLKIEVVDVLGNTENYPASAVRAVVREVVEGNRNFENGNGEDLV